MSKKACGLCGKDPAAGFATVDGIRYCHGDFDPEPTCYMRMQWQGASSSLGYRSVTVRPSGSPHETSRV